MTGPTIALMHELEASLFNTSARHPKTSTWAILDAARDERIYGDLVLSNVKMRCLFGDDCAADLVDVAAYLVPLAPRSAITRWVFSAWGKSWAIFIRSDQDSEVLKKHLQKHIFVYDENKRRSYFRYYDPRVLTSLLPTFDADSLERFFGPVTHFLAENHLADALLSFSRSNGRLYRQTLPLRNDT